MDPHDKKRILTCSTIAVGFVLLLIGGCVGYFALAESTTKTALRDVANALGATDESILAEHARTADLASRSLLVHFTTPLDRETFRTKVRAFDPAARDSGITGSSIFWNLNFAHKDVRIDHVPLRQLAPVLGEKEPSATEWSVHDAQARKFTVTFYRIPVDKAVYTIDGTHLTQNIVTILIQTR